MVLTGQLEDAVFTASARKSQANPAELSVKLRVDRSQDPDQLQGILTQSNCSEPVQIYGTKLH
jgi:hypothetical protein